jgi:pimeloyl-ACP methyl ester carboxylesterase
MDERIVIASDGLKLAGIVRTPEGLKANEKRAAFLVLHGFGSNKDAGNVTGPCDLLSKLGYITLRFDFRGCGESEGEKGRLICLEQVADTRNALTALAQRADVDAARIAVIGSSFGAAVAIYTAGVDPRVAAVVSSGGWGNGERKFQGQHNAPGAYDKFLAMLKEGREHRARTGQSLMVPRYAIVPIPGHLRDHLAKHSVQMFPAETAQSMFDFKAENVIGNIAPRPVLLLHSASDSVTPTEQSIEMFKRAGQPTELHLFADTDHFMFAEDNLRVRAIVRDWLERFFPAVTVGKKQPQKA